MVALVTGGGTGVGREIAVRLSSRTPVAVLGRRPEPLEQTADVIRAAGGSALVIRCDVTDAGAAADAVARARTELGLIDVLVNCAGYAGGVSRLSDGDAGDWETIISVNVIATARLCALTVPAMVAAGHGYVINISSLQGSRTSPGCGAYGASKAALMRLTDVLADELKDTGVSVFDLSPGLVDTEMTRSPGLAHLFADIPAEHWTPASKVADHALRLVSGGYERLTGRFVHAEDDLDALLERLDPADQDARRLRMMPIPHADPLFDDD